MNEDVKMLIFDLDGTLLNSAPAVLKVVNKACEKLGLGIKVTDSAVRAVLGKPAEQAYKELIGEKGKAWEEVMDKCDTEIAKFSGLFPKARETLAALRKRGYTLVLYSNASTDYFEIALSKLGIGQYFDYTECNGENRLPKAKLVRKIMDKYPNLKAAVIGDKIDDINAAKENKALSVGALYGYGKDEAAQADIKINSFGELLGVFR